MGNGGNRYGALEGFVCFNWLLWLSPSQVIEYKLPRSIAMWIAQGQKVIVLYMVCDFVSVHISKHVRVQVYTHACVNMFY